MSTIGNGWEFPELELCTTCQLPVIGHWRGRPCLEVHATQPSQFTQKWVVPSTGEHHAMSRSWWSKVMCECGHHKAVHSDRCLHHGCDCEHFYAEEIVVADENVKAEDAPKP